MATAQATDPFSTSTITGTLAAVRAVPQVARGGPGAVAETPTVPPGVSGDDPGERAGDPQPAASRVTAEVPMAAQADRRALGARLAADRGRRRMGGLLVSVSAPHHAADPAARQSRLPVAASLRSVCPAVLHTYSQ